MTKRKKMRSAGIVFIGTMLFAACNTTDSTNTNEISTDPKAIAAGRTIFEEKCTSCHNFIQDGIGPNLSGVTARASADWIRHFVKDPKTVVQSGDERAHELLKKYTVVMPSFALLKDEDLNYIVAYLHTQKQHPEAKHGADPAALKNPIPTPIASSGMEMGLQLVTQIPHSSQEQPHTRIAKLDIIPGDSTLFVMDQRGILYKLDHNKPVAYLDIAKWKPRFINQPGLATGLGSFAFHPEFLKNGTFYTTHTEAAGSKKADFAYADTIKTTLQWVLTEWKTDNPNAIPFTGTNRELLRIDMVSGIHGVQEITFNPYAKKGDADYGLLYIGVGDGGSVENGYAFLAHHLDRPWGTILRIDPQGHNSVNGQYGIPAQNPFRNSTGAKALPEIYAYGFRNPNRITWSRSGQMLATNIGQAFIESINQILPGHDYGWPVREGSFALHPSGDINYVYALERADSVNHITYPVAEYDHDEGKAISGGFEYTGNAIPQLKGKYLFGDVPSGRLFYVNMKDLKLGKQAPVLEWHVTLNGKQVNFKDVCGSDRVDLHFGRDSKGEIYLLTKPDGKVYKLVNAGKSKII